MKLKLYKCFDHWYHGGNLYVYSDTHFDDEDMSWRNITSQEQVKRINSKIGKNDTLIILGDIGNVEWINNIRGYKVLIAGNHDTGLSNYDKYFNEVYNGPLFIKSNILLSHECIELPFAINIHGHEHHKIYRDNCINVCAEHINYAPVRLDEIISGHKVEDIHRLTIDNATQRKSKNI